MESNNHNDIKKYIEDLSIEEIRSMHKPCDENGIMHIVGGRTKDNYILNDIHHKCEYWDRCKRKKECWQIVRDITMFSDKG